MKIEVDDDCIDHLVACALIEGYVNCKRRVKEVKKKKELTEYEKEDLEYSENLLPALDVVGAWFVYDWKEKVKNK
jgi:hypothetical protein